MRVSERAMLCRFTGLDHGVAQIPGEAVEDGRLQQERLHICGLLPQYLFLQVVENVAVAAGESADEPRNVIASPHRNGCHLQTGDLALGAPFQGSHILCREAPPHDLVVEELGRFLGRETQVRLVQLD